MLFQPAENASGQFGEIGNRNVIEGLKQAIHNSLEDLKLGVVRDAHLGVAGLRLMRLDDLFVISLHDAQRDDLLAQGVPLLLLLLLLLQQELYVIYRLLQHGGLGQLVAGRVRVLARRHQILQRVIALLDSVPALLFRLGMRLAAAFFVADSGVLVVAILVLFRSDSRAPASYHCPMRRCWPRREQPLLSQ